MKRSYPSYLIFVGTSFTVSNRSTSTAHCSNKSIENKNSLETCAKDFPARKRSKILDLNTADTLLVHFGRCMSGCDVGYSFVTFSSTKRFVFTNFFV